MHVKWCKSITDNGHSYYGVGIEKLGNVNNDRIDTRTSIPEDLINNDTAKISDQNKILRSLTTDLQKDLRRAKETAESKANDLEKLDRFASAVSSTLDLQAILQVICKEMVQIFQSRNTGIGLLNSEKTKLTIAAFHSASDEESDAIGMEIPLDGNVATLFVIQNGQPIVVPDVPNNPLTESIHDIASERGTQCLMIVPLKTRDEVIGTIGLPASDRNRIYTIADVLLAQKIATKITSAIENAHLYTKTEKAKNIAERDLEIGRKIQSGFFPSKLPTPPGWEIVSFFQAARQVAGDFYDVFQLEDGQRIGLVIGDVCDKGVGAALFMALFRSLIRAFTIQIFTDRFSDRKKLHRPAVEILKRTIVQTNNYIAITHNHENMFATIFFGILEPKTGLLNYCNSGHEAPVVIGQNTIKAHLKKTGPALGLFPDIEFSIEQIQLSPEDILFTYTDGVTDAQSKSGEFFTKKRLFELLKRPFPSADVLLKHIRTQIQNHISGTEQYDDLTILTVRRMENCIRAISS